MKSVRSAGCVSRAYIMSAAPGIYQGEEVMATESVTAGGGGQGRELYTRNREVQHAGGRTDSCAGCSTSAAVRSKHMNDTLQVLG